MRKPPAKAAFRRVHGRQRSGVAASGLSTLAFSEYNLVPNNIKSHAQGFFCATCPGLQNITMMVVQIGGGIGAIESNSHLLHVTSLPLVQENEHQHVDINFKGKHSVRFWDRSSEQLPMIAATSTLNGPDAIE